MASPLDSIILKCLYSKKKMFLTLCHMWDSNLQYSDPESMGRVVTHGGDLQDDLLTSCAGTLRTIAFITDKTGD